MKKLVYIYVCLMATTIFSACEEKNNSLLITSTTQLTFDADGGSQTFDIESNTDWTITSSADWLTVSPSVGGQNQTVTVTVAVSDNQLEEESKLVIHTNDGEKVVNISVKVEGSYVRSGKHLDIRNHKTRLFLGGKAGVIDSLRIRANIAWELKGPDWIEAWDGERWRPLSLERGFIKGKGSETVYVRTAIDNKEDDDIENLLIVSEQYTGEYKTSINVEQIGRLKTRPNIVDVLADGVAFDWICGCDVEKIYFRITDKEINGATHEEVRQSFDVTYPDYINSIADMLPNTYRILETHCEDANGVMGRLTNWYTLGSRNNQSRAMTAIVDAKQIASNRWRVWTKPDDETENYYVYATNNPKSAFVYNTPILYHIFMENLIYERKKFNKAGYFDWDMKNVSNEIHVFTRSTDMSGKSSDYISRYDRYYDANGNELPAKSLLDRIPKSMVADPSLR